MPVEKPISDLQRNFGSIADSRHKTKEPVRLTKNGPASLVDMDAKAHDDQTRALTTIQERDNCIHAPSLAVTTTSSTAVFAPGNRQRPRRIKCEPRDDPSPM